MQQTKKDNKKLYLSWAGACIIPLLVQIVVRATGLAKYEWFSTNDTEFDFFLVYKKFGIIIISAVMLFSLVKILLNTYDATKKYKCNKVIFGSLIIYAAMSILSSVFAEDVKTAFLGGYAQHESLFVLLGYFVMFAFTYYFVNNERNIVHFLRLFMWGVAVIAFLGVLQYIKADFFASTLGKNIITMFSDIKGSQVSLAFEPGHVYMTLYNPNYVGSYVAVTLPVIVAGIFVMEKRYEKIVMAVVSFMLVICLLGSNSTTGMTAIAVSVLLFAILCIPMYKKYLKQLAIVLTGIIVVLAVVVCINRDKIADALSKYKLSEDNYAYDNVVLHKDCVEVGYKGETLYLVCDVLNDNNAAITVYDSNRQELPLVPADNAGSVRVEGNEFYNGLIFYGNAYEDGSKAFSIDYGGKTLTFTNQTDDGSYQLKNVYGKFVKEINNAESIGFENHETFASRRGFIWSRSIPILKETLIIGAGPDNYIYKFPNDDYVSLANNSYTGEVVTKPHNMYLQI